MTTDPSVTTAPDRLGVSVTTTADVAADAAAMTGTSWRERTLPRNDTVCTRIRCSTTAVTADASGGWASAAAWLRVFIWLPASITVAAATAAARSHSGNRRRHRTPSDRVDWATLSTEPSSQPASTRPARSAACSLSSRYASTGPS